MKRRWMRLWPAATALLLVGCVEKRVSWSPDGRWAAVVGGDGLYLCDPSGALSERVAPDVTRVAWFPDSSRLAMVRNVEVNKWQDVAAHVTEDVRSRLIEAAKAVEQELGAYSGDLDEFEPKSVAALTVGETAAMALYLREHMSDELRAKVSERWDDLDKMSATLCTIEIVEVADGRGNIGKTIHRQLDDCTGLSVSSDGRFVTLIWGMPSEAGGDHRLGVLATDGSGAPRVVAERVSVHADWTPDGRGVVYAYSALSPAAEGKPMRLGAIARRTVRGDDGALLESFEDAQDLAGVVFEDALKLRCLADGRVLFSSMDVRLPATAKEMPQRGTLFAVALESPTRVTRMIPPDIESRVAPGVQLFEVSPDGARVSIPGDDGVCSIVTLASGELTQVQLAEDGDELRTVPTWRTNDELCLAVPPGSKHGSQERAEIVLWSPSAVRTISKSWPESVARGFLEKEKEKEEAESPGTATPAAP